MRVLVSFATEREFQPWRKLRSFTECSLGPDTEGRSLRGQATEVDGHRVHVVFTGIGNAHFDPNLPRLLKDTGVELLISSGLAGALRGQWAPVSMVGPKRVGTVGGAAGVPVSEGLANLAWQKGAQKVETLLTTDHVIAKQKEKVQLGALADAVDMESFEIVQACKTLGLPVVVVRAISDGAEEDLPLDFGTCLSPEGKIKALPLLKELLKQPWKIPALVRFGRQSQRAASRLAAFLDSYIQALSPELLRDEAWQAEGL